MEIDKEIIRLQTEKIKKNNNKKIDMLEDYNNDIINKIDDLLNR